MSEEIVIKTETVKVGELQEREKQIYDYAYKKGYNEAKEKRPIILCLALSGILFFIWNIITNIL